MPTLNIEGQKVKVDDSFLQLSPEEQNATVEEIAQSLGVSGQQKQEQQKQYTPDPDQLAAIGMDNFDPTNQLAKDRKAAREKALEEEYGKMDLGQRVGTFAENTLEGVPIAGPLIQRGADEILAQTIGRAQGYDPQTTREVLSQNRDIRESRAPIEAFTGNLTGATVAMGKLAQTQAGRKMMGIEGRNMPVRYGTGIATNAAISGGDTLARGGSPQDATASAALGGGITAAMPIASQGLKALGNKAKSGFNFATGTANPQKEAARRVSLAQIMDKKSGAGQVLNQADEVTARANQQPLMNVDRGGETTRALARSAANTSPEFRGQMTKAVQDRFQSQSSRAINTITRLVGGNVDDLQFQSKLKDAARSANRPAYEKAYRSPEAQAMWNDQLKGFLRSPAVQSAVRNAEKGGANRAVSEGIRPIKNPFVFGKDGSISLRQLKGGAVAKPNLEFWDQVQRELRKQAETAGRGTAQFNEIESVRRALNNTLDDTVPAFKQARQGAAAFFGAEDALEAGKKFARNRKLVPEAKRAFEGMKPAEKKAFQAGYTSDIIDTIRSSSDNRNIVQQVFGNPAARELNEMVLGKTAAKELEAFVRVESIMDQMRGALGNSSTARQLAEMGLAGGTGAGIGFATGQDWQTSMGMGAMLAVGQRGARVIGGKIDERILKEVGEILLSNDPSRLMKIQTNATLSPKWMAALEAYGAGLEKAAPLAIAAQ